MQRTAFRGIWLAIALCVGCSRFGDPGMPNTLKRPKEEPHLQYAYMAHCIISGQLNPGNNAKHEKNDIWMTDEAGAELPNGTDFEIFRGREAGGGIVMVWRMPDGKAFRSCDWP